MRHNPINWTDGMKINASHFKMSENAMREELYKSLSVDLNAFNYGLLAQPNNRSSLDVWTKLDQTGEFVVTVSYCHAITPGGKIIEISNQEDIDTLNEATSIIQQELERDGEKYLVLVVHPFHNDRTAFRDGQNNVDLGLTFTRPKYTLERISINDKFAPHQVFKLPIARLILIDGEVKIDPDYIPPCSTLSVKHSTDRGLVDIFDKWKINLELLESSCVKSLDRIRYIRIQGGQSVEYAAGVTIDVSEIAKRITERFLLSLVEKLPGIRSSMRSSPPVSIFETFQQLAKILQTELLFISPSERNRWDNFVGTVLKAPEYSSTIEQMIGEEYDHKDLFQFVKTSQKFLDMLLKIYDDKTGMPNSDFNWKETDDDGIEFTDHSTDNDILDIKP